jgi:pimeloyl-ACP methyl ester carboxylesterase
VRTDGPPGGGEICDIGGRRLAFWNAGHGRPPAVIDPGAGNFGLDYLKVHQAIATWTTSLIYDRAGYGWSDPDPAPRTARRITDDLRAMLQGASLKPPYVFVGHSLGGIYVRHFAQRFPDDVAGLVLVEPLHEDLYGRMPPLWRTMTDQASSALGAPPDDQELQDLKRALAQLFAGWPAALRIPLIERHLDPTAREATVAEMTGWDALYDEIRHGGPLPDGPMIVLTGGAVDPLPLDPNVMRSVRDTKVEVHAELAASVSRGEHRVVEDSGHMMNYQRPDAIARATKDVLLRITT